MNTIVQQVMDSLNIPRSSLSVTKTQNRSVLRELLNTHPDREVELLSLIAQQYGWNFLEEISIDNQTALDLEAAIPSSVAARFSALPVDRDESTVTVATSDPFDIQQKAAVQNAFSEGRIIWCLAPHKVITNAIQELYGVGAETFDEIIASRDIEDSLDLFEEENVIDESDDEASVLKFVNQFIREAIAQRATDIHIEPLQDDLRIRYRIDGILKNVPVPQRIKTLQSSVIARIKVMARLDIAEKRLPQDGRIRLKSSGSDIDVRVATIPCVEGENISLRLLSKEDYTLDKLGILTPLRKTVDRLLEYPNGIILVTGPTGCGKSTSLYCFLSELNTEQTRIVTIEDPVENKLRGVMQIAVKPEIDLTFANGLRSILRGDPNVIMVGEIRDLETAEISIRAALTGHLVLSTLHTNDSIGGISRLMDMGVEPFLIGSAVRAFMAQRLVRKLCEQCRVPANLSARQVDHFKIPTQAYGPSIKGCDHCNYTGYRGRLAIYEICEITPDIQELVSARATDREIRQLAIHNGFLSMRDYGLKKVQSGETSLDEVLLVTE